MKFNHLLVVDIDRGKLEPEYWQQMESRTEQLSFTEFPNVEKDADGLLVGFETIVDRTVIGALPNLKYIGVLGTAFDRVDVAAARERGIVVTNLPGYSTEAVAEFVFGMLLVHYRDLHRALGSAEQGKYEASGSHGREIRGKVFGIIGLGRIGTRVAEIARGFGADVRYFSRHRKPEMEARGIRYQPLKDLVREADIMSLHVTGGKETEGLLGREILLNMKPSAVIVNTVSMKVFDLEALEERLRRGDLTLLRMHSKSLTGEQWQRLSQYNGFVVYPAISNVTDEANQARQEMLVRNIEAFLAGTPENTV